ncbi:hypothetical protein [Rhizobium sp. PAMB 3182]
MDLLESNWQHAVSGNAPVAIEISGDSAKYVELWSLRNRRP